MDTYIISNGKIIQTDQVLYDKHLVVENVKIVAITDSCEEYENYPIIDAKNCYVSPGLVESHIHGCGEYGFDIECENVIEKTAEFLSQYGANTFIPTIQCNETTLKMLTDELDSNRALQKRVPGIYIEGPFISTIKKGGIRDKHIKETDVDYLKKIIELSKGYIKLMTIAPELEGIEIIFTMLKENNIIPCFGHSNAELKDIPSLQSDDTINMTHLYNGMSPISHKMSGLSMLPFINSNIFFELNADCIHLSKEIIELSYQHLNHDRLLLITDAVISAGLKKGEYTYYDKEVISGTNGVRYKDNDVLIGSNCLILDVIKNLITITDAPIYEAIKFATYNPVRLLGAEYNKGSIVLGKDADIILFDDDFNVSMNLIN